MGLRKKNLLRSLKGFPVLAGFPVFPFRVPLWAIATASGAFDERALPFPVRRVRRGFNNTKQQRKESATTQINLYEFVDATSYSLFSLSFSPYDMMESIEVIFSFWTIPIF